MPFRKITFTLAIAATFTAIWVFRAGLIETMIWFATPDAVLDTIRGYDVWGPLILFFLFVLQVFLAFIPGQALMVACGYLYGFGGGFLLSWFSLVAGGELAFVLARRFGRPFAERWVSCKTLSKWDRLAAGQGIVFFAVSLLLPLIPNDAMCYVAGLGKISRPHFTAANMLGRGAACMLTSAAGAFGNLIPWQAWSGLIGFFILLGVAWQAVQRRTLS